MRHVICAFILVAQVLSVHGGNWPQFRGPGGLGIAESSYGPIHFNAASNVLWKLDLPAGNSSPSIWGDRLFLTCFEGGKLETLCIDRTDARFFGRQTAPAEKFEPTHRLGSPATPTPAC